MHLHLLDRLRRLRIVLASASPRRREILLGLGLVFDVVPSRFAEDLDKAAFDGPAGYVAETSRRKAHEVADRLRAERREVDLIVSADTIVVKDGAILEKPADAAHAKRMLQLLNNAAHTVLTAVTLVVPRTGATRCFVEETHVDFADLPEVEMDAYIGTGEPFDKAGGYGIQGAAAPFVRGVRGCYFNVVGFPSHQFSRELVALVAAGQLLL
eukprot:Unigene4854_Nuclearia_a/m.14854 Unigene4854_Nuclearia_a/g.14854  ORF Unigene4854_Nuclearia_a/g.14854 Unigene4854_Nuclearia_a/m.14854 type:complete len:212 (+) Unigene4854_Nuclearia_a:47-682(+)